MVPTVRSGVRSPPREARNPTTLAASTKPTTYPKEGPPKPELWPAYHGTPAAPAAR
jgi:hypothetical protein